jgi:hypothetical protein
MLSICSSMSRLHTRLQIWRMGSRCHLDWVQLITNSVPTRLDSLNRVHQLDHRAESQLELGSARRQHYRLPRFGASLCRSGPARRPFADESARGLFGCYLRMFSVSGIARHRQNGAWTEPIACQMLPKCCPPQRCSMDSLSYGRPHWNLTSLHPVSHIRLDKVVILGRSHCQAPMSSSSSSLTAPHPSSNLKGRIESFSFLRY